MVHFHNQQQLQQQKFDSIPQSLTVTATIDDLNFVASNTNENNAGRFYHQIYGNNVLLYPTSEFIVTSAVVMKPMKILQLLVIQHHIVTQQ